MTRFTLTPKGPFDLRAPIEFLQGFIPAGERGQQPPGHLHLAFPLDGTWQPVGVCLQGLEGEVFGEADSEAVRRQTERVLSLDVDGTGWPEVGQRDPVVKGLQESLHFLRPVLFYSPYEAAVWAILSAHSSMRQAARIKTQLATKLGHTVDIHGHRLPTFPAPRRLLEVEAIPGVTPKKMQYLHAVCHEVIGGRLDAARLRSMPGDDAITYLQGITGIGPFSADHILLRGAGAPDRLTTNEPRVLQAFAAAYGPNADLTSTAEAWRPYRTWVLVLLRSTAGGADPRPSGER